MDKRLEDLNAGQPVAVLHNGELVSILVIRRLTPTQLIVMWGAVSLRFRRRDGEAVGRSPSTWGPYRWRRLWTRHGGRLRRMATRLWLSDFNLPYDKRTHRHSTRSRCGVLPQVEGGGVCAFRLGTAR